MKDLIIKTVTAIFLCHHTFMLAQNHRETSIFMFEPEKISTNSVEYSSSLSTSGKEIFFTSSKSLKSVDTNIYFTEFRTLLEKYKAQAIFSK